MPVDVASDESQMSPSRMLQNLHAAAAAHHHHHQLNGAPGPPPQFLGLPGLPPAHLQMAGLPQNAAGINAIYPPPPNPMQNQPQTSQSLPPVPQNGVNNLPQNGVNSQPQNNNAPLPPQPGQNHNNFQSQQQNFQNSENNNQNNNNHNIEPQNFNLPPQNNNQTSSFFENQEASNSHFGFNEKSPTNIKIRLKFILIK